MPTKPCTKCQCQLVWDATATAPNTSQRFKDGKLGWFREDLSKQLHYMDRCNNFQKSKEFMTEPQAVQNAQTNPNVQNAPSPLMKTMDVTDLAEPGMRREIQVHCKVLNVIESEVEKFLGNNPNPAKVGMYMKMIYDMMEKK